jgi:hypothetical protein
MAHTVHCESTGRCDARMRCSHWLLTVVDAERATSSGRANATPVGVNSGNTAAAPRRFSALFAA